MILNQKDIFRDISAFRMQQFLHTLTYKWANLDEQKSKKQQMYDTLREIHQYADSQATSEQLRDSLKRLEGYLHDDTLDLENQEPELLQSVLKQIEHLTQVVEQRVDSAGTGTHVSETSSRSKTKKKHSSHNHSRKAASKQKATRRSHKKKDEAHTSTATHSKPKEASSEASAASSPKDEPTQEESSLSADDKQLREHIERIAELEKKYEELKNN